jgi:uncharacterized membrane protein YeiH
MAEPLGGAVALRRRLEITAGLGVLALVTAVAGGIDPESSGAYPACPFRAITGLACPGCGSLRALHDLVHGSPVAALDHNAVFVVALVAAVLLSLRALAAPAARAVSPWLPYAALGLLALWTVVRNLPWAPFAVLAP